jgi:hypothetical protein
MNKFENNFKASMFYLSKLLEEQGKYDDSKTLMFIATIDYSRPLEKIKEILKRYVIALEKRGTKNI